MMSVSGLERCTTETSSGLSSASRVPCFPSVASLRTSGVRNSAVSTERNCTTTAVDDALMILAISRITPGAVSCRLMVVRSTSSGTGKSEVSTSVTQAISTSFTSSKRRAGNIVKSIVTVE